LLACSIVGQSDFEPMMMPTAGCMSIPRVIRARLTVVTKRRNESIVSKKRPHILVIE